MEVFFQAVHAPFPQAPVRLYPICYVPHRGGIEVVQLLTANFARSYQPRVLQDTQVFHHTEAGHRQVRAQLGESLPVGSGEHIEQVAAVVISQRVKYVLYFHTFIISD